MINHKVVNSELGSIKKKKRILPSRLKFLTWTVVRFNDSFHLKSEPAAPEKLLMGELKVKMQIFFFL